MKQNLKDDDYIVNKPLKIGNVKLPKIQNREILKDKDIPPDLIEAAINAEETIGNSTFSVDTEDIEKGNKEVRITSDTSKLNAMLDKAIEAEENYEKKKVNEDIKLKRVDCNITEKVTSLNIFGFKIFSITINKKEEYSH